MKALFATHCAVERSDNARSSEKNFLTKIGVMAFYLPVSITVTHKEGADTKLVYKNPVFKIREQWGRE